MQWKQSNPFLSVGLNTPISTSLHILRYTESCFYFILFFKKRSAIVLCVVCCTLNRLNFWLFNFSVYEVQEEYVLLIMSVSTIRNVTVAHPQFHSKIIERTSISLNKTLFNPQEIRAMCRTNEESGHT